MIEFVTNGIQTVKAYDPAAEKEVDLHFFRIHPDILLKMMHQYLQLEWIADREHPENF